MLDTILSFLVTKPTKEGKLCFLLYLNPFGPNPRRREKINLNFYCHTSLWRLKKFYEGFKAFIKPEAPQRIVKIKI